jgi:hypothetical protein
MSYHESGGTWCQPYTSDCYMPLIIDVNGNGFDLTSNANGINFNAFGDGLILRTAWTKANSDDAWLALDRNGNGTIDDGTELFSAAAPQPLPVPDIKNGFNALVQYDKPENGGNSDGKINHLDSIFLSLRLWQDLNHNGISEAGELRTLPQVGLASIDLDYRESRRVDQHGNVFRYRAKVLDIHGAQIGRWVYDVFPQASRAN